MDALGGGGKIEMNSIFSLSSEGEEGEKKKGGAPPPTLEVSDFEKP